MDQPSSLPGALPSASGVAPLPHWGVIRASGVDAVTFLQGQLTNDVATLGAGQARLAGFCSAKGRLQASFVVWRDDPGETVWLACAASVLPATLKRLSMFVLRARCKLTDASAEQPLWGEAGSGAAPGLAVWQRADVGGARRIRLPDAAGVTRALRLDPPAADAPVLAEGTWRWLEVQSGIATIEAATVDLFVPQMVNYELLGGVDFQKGCYPGQEVVARSQYRGTLKRRSFLFDVEAPAAPGDEIWGADDAANPAGRVVEAAATPGRPELFAVLAEIKLAALDGAPLRLGRPDGPALVRRTLPYAVPVTSVD